MSEVKMSEVIKMSETKIAEVFVSGIFRNRMQVIMQAVKYQVAMSNENTVRSTNAHIIELN